MIYHTYNCESELQDFIKCYWTLTGALIETQNIVPDGCAEMIIHRGDLYRQYAEDGTFHLQPRSFIFGQITKPLMVQPEGRTEIFAVRFHPHGLAPFCSMPLSELENRAVDLRELFGDQGAELENAILKAADVSVIIERVEAFLWHCFLNNGSFDDRVNSAVSVILQSTGAVNIQSLASDSQVQQRQLQRMFKQRVGLSPKQLARLVRLQAAIRQLNEGKFSTLAEMALEFNYYDQAHFIKEFKEFTGITPGEFYHPSFQMSQYFSS